MAKRCYKCGETKEDSRFYRDKSRVDGLMNRCKQCDADEKKRHKQTPIGRAVNRSIQRKHGQRVKQLRIRLKNSGCFVCGYTQCYAALEFHHLRGKDKDMNECGTYRSLMREVARCVVVCANCHREIHAGLHPHITRRYVQGCKQGQLSLVG